jgi:hypothetical protein
VSATTLSGEVSRLHPIFAPILRGGGVVLRRPVSRLVERTEKPACCTASYGVACHPVPCTTECSFPVQKTAASHRSRYRVSDRSRSWRASPCQASSQVSSAARLVASGRASHQAPGRPGCVWRSRRVSFLSSDARVIAGPVQLWQPCPDASMWASALRPDRDRNKRQESSNKLLAEPSGALDSECAFGGWEVRRRFIDIGPHSNWRESAWEPNQPGLGLGGGLAPPSRGGQTTVPLQFAKVFFTAVDASADAPWARYGATWSTRTRPSGVLEAGVRLRPTAPGSFHQRTGDGTR